MGHQIIKKLSFSVLYSISIFSFADSIIVQSTTSTKNSGLYDYLLPRVSTDTGIKVNVVAVGTGQAIKNAQRCDGDVLLVHAKPSEERFVAQGFGIERFDLMYNDFVIVGPADDPASINGSNDVSEALKKIAVSEAIFTSRGDDSGTHKAELRLWKDSTIDPTKGIRTVVSRNRIRHGCNTQHRCRNECLRVNRSSNLDQIW